MYTHTPAAIFTFQYVSILIYVPDTIVKRIASFTFQYVSILISLAGILPAC